MTSERSFVCAFTIAMRYAVRVRQNGLLNDRLAVCESEALNYKPYGNLKAIYVPMCTNVCAFSIDIVLHQRQMCKFTISRTGEEMNKKITQWHSIWNWQSAQAEVGFLPFPCFCACSDSKLTLPAFSHLFYSYSMSCKQTHSINKNSLFKFMNLSNVCVWVCVLAF